MTKRELREYKKHHCFHSCNLCDYKKICWEELGVEERPHITLKYVLIHMLLPSVIGFLVMFWLINIICNSFMM